MRQVTPNCVIINCVILALSKIVTADDCLSTANAGSPYFVDSNIGNDAYPGTESCPKKTINSTVILLQKGDTVFVQDGFYQEENIDINSVDDITISGVGDNAVFDGSMDVFSDLGKVWEEHEIMGDEGRMVWKVDVGIDAWQLFLDGQEQVPARWPNAEFTDPLTSSLSVFDVNKTWAQGSMDWDKKFLGGGLTEEPYVNGEMIDAGSLGKEGAINSLRESGINPVGAIAILNTASFKSYSRIVESYDFETSKFTHQPIGSDYATKHHSYSSFISYDQAPKFSQF